MCEGVCVHVGVSDNVHIEYVVVLLYSTNNMPSSISK